MSEIPKPTILREGTHSPRDLEELKTAKKIWREADIYTSQLGELFEITNPGLLNNSDFEKRKKEFVRDRAAGQRENLKGNWIYYPWSGILLHSVIEAEHIALITNRNRDLVTLEEQKKLLEFRVGIVGLSVGSNVAAALAYGGIARTMKIAEFDTLEMTNLNRIRARIDQIGMPKAAIVAQQIYEVNPYAELVCFTEGLTKETLQEFVQNDPKPQLIFEIMDSFEMKMHLRSLAQREGIPVIMVTNLGDRLLMDVERYDLDRATPFFNGRAGDIPQHILDKPDLTTADKHNYAVLLAGGEKNIPKRALDSVADIGKRLVGRPQLGSTVTVSGGIGSYLTRKIALGDAVSGSWLIDFDKAFGQQGEFKIA